MTRSSDGGRTRHFGSGNRKAFLDLPIEQMLVRGDGHLDARAIGRVTDELDQLAASGIAPVHARSRTARDHLDPVVDGRIGAVDERDGRTILTNLFCRMTALLRTCSNAHVSLLKRTGNIPTPLAETPQI